MNGQKDIGFEAVYDEYYDRIYKYAYTLLLNREEAEDVTADTFLTAWEKFSQYDASKASVQTWLSTIVHNRAVDLMKSAAYSRRAELSENLASSGMDKISDHLEMSETVLWLFSRLTPEERELLNMRYVMELKDEEIAALLDMEKKTVNKRIQRLLAKCRNLLNGKEEKD